MTTPRHCHRCGYALSGLRDNVCPECGRKCDPAHPDRYDLLVRPRNSRALLAVIYVVLFVLWAFLLTPTNPGMVGSFSLPDRICMGVGATAGPVALMLVLLDVVPPTWKFYALIAIPIWAIWISVACLTSLRRLRYALHAAFAVAWGSFGALADFVEAALS